MALNATQLDSAARKLGLDIYEGGRRKTATMHFLNLRAAIESIDAGMDTVINTIPAGQQTKTVKQALVDNLPEPFQTQSTAQEKALALAVWGFEETGVL